MARLDERDYTYFTTVRGLCPACLKTIPARVFFRDGSVWQQSLCPDCCSEAVEIASDRDWYLREAHSSFVDVSPVQGAHEPKLGCPHDCGPCTWHSTPFAGMTVNTSDAGENLPELLKRAIDTYGPVANLVLRDDGQTEAAKLIELMSVCKRPALGREVTLETGACRFASDEGLRRSLQRTDVSAVLTMNLNEVGEHLREALALMGGNDCVRRLVVQSVGLPIDRAVATVCEASGGILAGRDFTPADGSHPLCTAVATTGKRGAVLVHARMSAATFDCSRSVLCPHAVLGAAGKLYPGCAYDLIHSGARSGDDI